MRVRVRATVTVRVTVGVRVRVRILRYRAEELAREIADEIRDVVDWLGLGFRVRVQGGEGLG